jgi:hypothetical protein
MNKPSKTDQDFVLLELAPPLPLPPPPHLPGLQSPEMELLDINLTKTRVFCSCYSQPLLLVAFKENHTLLWF